MTTQFCVLQRDALLHITGPDALTFLQGQTTCDTSTVSEANAVPGAYCNPQGRIVCDFLLMQLGNEHFGLRMRQPIVEKSAEVFGKYIIFSKAELAADRSDWAIVALWGEGAAAQLADLTSSAFTGQYSTISGDSFKAVQLDEAATLFECYVQAQQLTSFVDALKEQTATGEEAYWQAQQIAAGIARIEAATVEEFVPQIINYDITGHVNFKKGCYTGQEVVARLHYRGTPKRRTYIAEIASDAPPKAGTPVFSNGSEQSIGMVVNSAVGAAGASALVAVTITAADDTLHLNTPDGEPFTVHAPPYPLGTEA